MLHRKTSGHEVLRSFEPPGRRPGTEQLRLRVPAGVNRPAMRGRTGHHAEACRHPGRHIRAGERIRRGRHHRRHDASCRTRADRRIFARGSTQALRTEGAVRCHPHSGPGRCGTASAPASPAGSWRSCPATPAGGATREIARTLRLSEATVIPTCCTSVPNPTPAHHYVRRKRKLSGAFFTRPPFSCFSQSTSVLISNTCTRQMASRELRRVSPQLFNTQGIPQSRLQEKTSRCA